MIAQRLPGGRAEGAALALGTVALVSGAAYLTLRTGAPQTLGPVVAVLAALGVTAGFARAPHVMIAATIPFMVALPTVTSLWVPWLGPSKDALVLAAVAGVALARRGPADAPLLRDPWLLAAGGLLLLLYVVNPADGHGAGWFHATRLVAEPLALLVVALAVPSPRRCLGAAMSALIGTSVVVALIGLAQQAAGPGALADLGFRYGEEIRTIDGRLRSFGTLDEPFAYAALLLLGLVAVWFWMRPGPWRATAATVILAGLAGSLVRTAALAVVALLALWLVRRGRPVLAAALAAALIAFACLILLDPGASRAERISSSPDIAVTLNGRSDAWAAVLGGPATWPFGRGAGEIGTGASRAEEGLVVEARHASRDPGTSVDSAYLAAVADVGLVGLAVLLVLLGRLGVLALASARDGRREGLLAGGFLTVLIVDGLTRSSFTGFPTAFIGMLVIGLALSAARVDDRP